PGVVVRRLMAALGIAGATRLEGATTSLFCIDDLQWVDESSLRSVGTWIRDRGAGLVALFADRREDALELFPHRNVFLDVLSAEDAARVVTTAFPGAARAVVGKIVATAGGLPFVLTMLARDAAQQVGAGTTDRIAGSVSATVSRRITRVAPAPRTFARLCSLVHGVADLRALARASEVSLDIAAGWCAELSDLLETRNIEITFRHPLLRDAVNATIAEPVGLHRRLLKAYLAEPNAIDRAATVLRCAGASGDDLTAATTALAMSRRAAASGASATALEYLTIALRHAGTPPPAEYAIDYATVLSQLGRDDEAATFLRRELRDTIERGDARRAADLALPFASVTLTLERHAEFDTIYHRIAAMSSLDEQAARTLRSARFVALAFGGRFDEYDSIAPRAETLADRRIAAFVAALRGRDADAQTWLETYEAGLRSTDSRLEPADRALIGLIGLHGSGNSAIANLADGEGDASAPYHAIAQLSIAARIHDGRWDEARRIVDRLPLWDRRYEEPVPLLEARLELDALAGRKPRELQRTARTLRALFARHQVRYAVTPARWYLIALQRSGLPADPDIVAFVEGSLHVPPIPYSVCGTPVAVALMQHGLPSARCLDALAHWPRADSRWNRAHRILAAGLLGGDRTALRRARDDFDQMSAPVFAMIAGLALPTPRAKDVELARALGYKDEATPVHPLTAREADVAELVAQDLGNRAIAARLGISERTVEVHLTNLYRKLGLRSRSGLARLVEGNWSRSSSGPQ
ncbi:MAG: LuxR C-terminal-related transcriptional regulator, partial [Candidatus Eremiobacteraeota bacterium]|nr:LuxR C-terminal-related transcriptional regulator [Candidatus Eremiobacteraeota bacterium]